MRRHGNPDGVRLLVTHGNGFAADAYYPYWRHLLSGFDVLVFDFRNHGQNAPVVPSNHNYAQLTRDLERVVDAHDALLGILARELGREVRREIARLPAARGSGRMRGRTTVKWVPCPGADSTSIRPWWAWMIPALIDRPTRTPGCWRLRASSACT
jgi:pimeloyl-ACP methyl ester carboxylesterase